MKLSRERITDAMPTAFVIMMIAICRLLPHPWNFAPVSASAIFGGIYLNKKWAFILPIASMLIADTVLGFSLADMPFVYGSILLAAAIGLWIGSKRENKTAFTLSVISGTVSSSVIFYLITNFGSWLTLDMYTKDLSGLLQSYVMAIPFFQNSIAGDLFFISVFVIGYEFLSALVSKTGNKPSAVIAK
jgi:hypothetical protein